MRGPEFATSGRAQRVALATSVLASLGSAGACVAGWVNDYVNQDQALLWAAAESWGRLEPHEPAFWGQTYGTTLEAIPARIIALFGLGYGTALPLAIALLNLGMWVVLGFAALRQGRKGWAAAAFGALALLSTEHLVIATTFNTVAGRFLACLAAAVFLGWQANRTSLYVSMMLGAVALVLEPSVLLICAPLAVYALSEWWSNRRGRNWREWVWLAAAAGPAAVWLAFTSWWSSRHPEQDLHPAPALNFAWDRARDNLAHPGRHLGAFVPVLAPTVLMPIAAVALLGAFAIRYRSYRRIAALAALVVAYAFALASPKAYDYFDTALFPAERIVLGLAPALWFVAAAEPWPAIVRARRWLPSTVVCIGAACALSTGWRVIRWDAQMEQERARATAEWRYSVTPVTEIAEVCEKTGAAATALNVKYAVFHDRTAAYACSATTSEIITVFPEYERRSWVLRQFLEADDLNFLFVGPAPHCPPWITCTATWPDVTLVSRPHDRPMDDTLWDMAIQIRAPYQDYP